MKHLRPYFKALCDDRRLEIIGFLVEREHCICELIEKLGLSQATVSYHVKLLNDMGLISCRQIGRSTYCSISKSGFKSYVSLLEERMLKPILEATPKDATFSACYRKPEDKSKDLKTT